MGPTASLEAFGGEVEGVPEGRKIAFVGEGGEIGVGIESHEDLVLRAGIAGVIVGATRLGIAAALPQSAGRGDEGGAGHRRCAHKRSAA